MSTFEEKLNLIEKQLQSLRKLAEIKPKSYFKLIDYLISNKDEIDINKALHFAAEIGDFELVKYFIEKGASYFNSAMYQACRGGHFEIVEYLVNIENCKGFELAIISAIHGGNFKIVKFLAEKFDDKKISPQALLGASAHGDLEILEYILDREKGNFERAAICGAICEASKNGHLSIVKSLLEKTNSEEDYYNIRNALNFALKKYDCPIEIIKYLGSKLAITQLHK